MSEITLSLYALQQLLHSTWRAAQQAPPPGTCPHCREGQNSRECGGNEKCFHCGTCNYIACMWTDAEKLAMLAELQVQAASSVERGNAERADPDREALEALVREWQERADALTNDREVMRDDRVKARALRACADALDAILKGER